MMRGPMMTRPHQSRVLRIGTGASLALLAVLPGCLNPAAPPPVRYFDPPVLLEAAPASPRTKPVRLVAVTGRRMISENIIWRMTDLEVAFDELNRWAEAPDRLVERALRRALFASGALRAIAAGEATEHLIEVEVTAFEHRQSEEVARVEIEVLRSDADGLVQTKRFVAQVAAAQTAQGTTEDYVRAMGVALSRVVTEVRDWLLTS